MQVACKNCSSTFYCRPGRPALYCSLSCRDQYNQANPRYQVRLCDQCNKQYRPRQRVKPSRFCSKTCGYEWQREQKAKNPRSVYVPNHPLCGVNGYLAKSRFILYEKIGPGLHPCTWCKKPLVWQKGLSSNGIEADHLNWNRLDDQPNNLVPSCGVCNKRRQRRFLSQS